MICENCGKEHDGIYGSGRFCCASCRASYTNKRRGKRTKETKQKISEGVRKKLLLGTYKPHNLYTNGISKDYIQTTINDLVETNYISNPNMYHIKNKFVNKLKYTILHTCSECNHNYYGYITKYGNISVNYCSEECALLHMKNKIKKNIKERIENGTFSGWKTRNIISYAEQFWINVLLNNNINYIKEYHLNNKYFLDFYIIKNNIKIDLEIDGKQHKYEDRIIHDQIRDEYVKALNILVYRIDWNEIKSDKGSLLMKEKINKFLNWYNNL